MIAEAKDTLVLNEKQLAVIKAAKAQSDEYERWLGSKPLTHQAVNHYVRYEERAHMTNARVRELQAAEGEG